MRVSRKKKPTSGVVDKELKKAIIKWRKDIWTRDFGDSQFGPSAVLSDADVESVSSLARLIGLSISKMHWVDTGHGLADMEMSF